MDIGADIRINRTQHGLHAGLPWACYEFSDRFPGFDGHFPGQPVLPGVCMLMAAVVTLEDWHRKDIRVRAVRKARFLSPIRPGQRLIITCTRHHQQTEEHTAQLTLRGGGDRKTSECIIQYTCSERDSAV